MRFGRGFGPAPLGTLCLAACLGGSTARADAINSYRLPTPSPVSSDSDAADRMLNSLPPTASTTTGQLPTAADLGFPSVLPAKPPGAIDSVILARSLRLTLPDPGSDQAVGRTGDVDSVRRVQHATSWFGKTRTVPEPASLCLLLAGLIGIAARRWLLRAGARA